MEWTDGLDTMENGTVLDTLGLKDITGKHVYKGCGFPELFSFLFFSTQPLVKYTIQKVPSQLSLVARSRFAFLDVPDRVLRTWVLPYTSPSLRLQVHGYVVRQSFFLVALR
jgi:hypothetical protein